MRKLAVWLNRILWTGLVVTVLALGVLVALGRHYAPWLERHTGQLVAELSDRTGLKFEVARARADWQVFAPRFELEGVRLFHPDHPQEVVARIDRIGFRVNLLRSLQSFTPVLNAVEGVGLSAVVEEATLGRWQLRGFPVGRGGEGGRLFDLLLAVRSARIDDSTIQIRFFNGGETELRGALRLQRAGSFRRLLLAMATANDGAPVGLTLEARGDPRQRDTFAATAYAEFTGVDLSPILPLAQGFGLDLRHGRIDGRAWLTWTPGGSFVARGEAAVPEVDLAALIGREAAPVSNISGRFVMSERPGERQLWIHDMTGDWGGSEVHLERLWIAQKGDQPEQLLVAVPELDLAQASALLVQGRLLPERWRQALEGLAPTGTLHDLVMTVPAAPRHRDRLLMRARVDQVTVSAWRAVPGIEGASGYVEAGLDSGKAWLDTPHLSLTFPRLYRDPIKLASSQGRIDWRIAAGRVGIVSSTLETQLDTARARLQFAVDLPLVANASIPPQMGLLAELRDGTTAAAEQLIPVTISPQLRDWLVAAELDGQIPRAGFLYRGSLQGGADDRTVQLYAEVEEGELHFHPDWPAAKDVEGRLWLDDGKLVAEVRQARLFDHILISDAQVALGPDAATGSLLRLAGHAEGEGDDWLRLLRDTPLGEHATAALAALHWRGPASADVALAMPIGPSAQELAVEISGALLGGELAVANPAVQLTRLRGNLTYRLGPPLSSDAAPRGLHADVIHGELYRRPLRATVATDKDGTIRAEIATTLGVADWQAELPIPSGWLRGIFPVEAQASWRDGSGQLTARSSLVGLAVDLPEPLAKAPEVPRPLTLRVATSGGSLRPLDAKTLNARAAGGSTSPGRERSVGEAGTRLHAQLGDIARLGLDWTEGELERGLLKFGAEPGDVGVRRGTFAITGDLPALALAPWQTVWREWSRAPAEGGGILEVEIEELSTPTLELWGQQLQSVQVDGARLADRWVLHLQSDRATGDITLPLGSQAAPSLRLTELRLPALAEDEEAGEDGAAAGLGQFHPAQAARLDFTVERLWLGEEELGSVGFAMQPIEHGLALTALQGSLRGIRLQSRPDAPAVLSWTRVGGIDRTTFDGRLATGDIGRVIEQWGFERAIASREGYLDLSVAWPGTPAAFAVEAVSGAASLQLQDGRFLRAPSSTTGALKMVGVFNLANLVRRLRLDFTDFFSDGIAYDEITGSFQLAQGTIETVQPLEVSSPSSRFRLSGGLDFRRGVVDMDLVVTLPLASNLPWVAALAGGLPAAAGVYIASKLFSEQVDRYSSAVYHVEGDWRDPTIRFRRMFDEAEEATAEVQDD